MNTKMIIIGVALVVGLGGSFVGGMTYAKAHAPATPKFSGQFTRGAGGPGGESGGVRGASGGFVSGEIITKDDNSITVKDQTGNTKIIFVSDQTSVAKAEAGTLDDLSVGTTVTVTGAASTDGSMTAQSVQIRPEMQKMDTATN